MGLFKKGNTALPDIFEYLDYRAYLKDAFGDFKKKRRAFTQRYVASKVGMKSTGHVSWILQGKRNISEKLLPSFIEVLELKGNAAEFFKFLVGFNQAKTHVDKKYFLDRMVACQKKENKKVKLHQYELFSKWYYPVVRELVAIHNISDNYKFLAAKVIPRISPSEAEEAVVLLERLGFIRKNKKGIFEQSHPTLTTGKTLEKVAVRQYQMDTFDLAKQALDNIPREDRDISTLTMSISRKRFEQIKKRIQELREEIMAAVKTEEDQEQVYELNMALFPLSKPKEGKK